MTEAPSAVTAEVRAAFDRHLACADQDAAVALTLDLVERGVPAEAVLLDLIAAAQHTVGLRWAENKWSVAQEHAATYVSEQCVAALSAAVRRPGDGAPEREVVVACVDREWHALPARILAEVLRLRGFSVAFLGAHVPAPHLLTYLHENGPDLVALSCMLPARLPHAHRLIEAAHLAGTPVMVGGPGFGADGLWARTLGADLWAGSAVQAARLLADRWPPALTGESALVHLADEEYGLLVRDRAALLQHLVDDLRERFPPMRAYTEQSYDATVEDLGHLLDFLAAGVFVDDETLLADFLAYTAAILASRGVPAAGLWEALRSLRGPLHRCPRALAQLSAGERRLVEEGIEPPP
ncbi:cobalamin-dependent protein [Streptomyces sp. ACA25]|uniref:cobalamin B12-binding domain-containing protein n=1 Tax=Streptomyces sp. ACA25 TaxID=3022596 RepID=UPI002307527A|nr:cobalamin-dependent protein [Streptomyces sp. ACA25]MDB1089222.1 cobalamin-dependent protein [Streptomyces sp. ACA25]